MKLNLKNNIVFLIDASGSMSHLRDKVIEVFNSQIADLIQKSSENEQETRVTVYSFSDITQNICWDVDCLRAPSIEKFYRPGGSTAMLGAILQAIADVSKIPQIYGDYSNLMIILSDGQNNIGNHLSTQVKQKLAGLDNWTCLFLGPDSEATNLAQSFGFAKGNCLVWNINAKGLEAVGVKLKAVTSVFMDNRSKGIKTSNNLFTLDTQSLSAKSVSSLDVLDSNDYQFLAVRKEGDIKSFVESWKLPFRQGANYYQLTKKEKIQGGKAICIREKKNGKVYTGDNARSLLGLPNYEVKVEAASHPKYDIFVQSSSVNRKLVPGTELLVMK